MATFSTSYPLNVQVGATDDYDLAKIQYSLDGGAWTDWQIVSGLIYDSPVAPGGLPVGLGADGDVRVLDVRAVDAGGNTSNVMTYSYTTDLSGPAFSFAMSDADMCGNLAGYTNDPVVAVAITSADPHIDLIRTYDGTAWGLHEAYATFGGTITLAGGDGTKNSAIELVDLFGNANWVWADATIELDQVVPPTTQDFALAGGAAKTNTVNITADVTGFSAPFYKVSETEADLGCDQGGWLTPAHPFPITLSANDEVKTVHFVTMDNAGNQSPVQHATIELDGTAPTVTSVEMDDCSNHWAANDVTITFPDGDVVWIGIQDNGGGYTWYHNSGNPMVSPYVASYNMTTAPANGTPVAIDVQLWDNSMPTANKGNGATSIMMDYGAGVPTLTSVTLKDRTSGNTTLSNETTVLVEFDVPVGGMDINAIRFSEDAGGSWSAWEVVDFTAGGLIGVEYDFASATDQALDLLDWEAKDCADNTISGSDGIYFDFIAPAITAVEIDGGADESSDLSLTVVLTVTELWPGAGDESGVELSLTDDFAVVQSFAWAASYEFTVDAGDGERCIYARMTDRAGNASNEEMFDCINVDMTTPSGTFNIVSNNDASDGYTNTRYVHFEDIVVDDDVVAIAFRNRGSDSDENPDVGTSTGWIYLNTLVDPASANPASFYTSSPVGTKVVSMRLLDDAGNFNAWDDIVDDIVYNPAAPAAPSSGLTVTPIASAFLDWDDDPDVAEWHIRYSFTEDYPLYDQGTLGANYPMAATMTTGFPAGMDLVTTESEYDFVEGPGPDVYTFTVWALGKNGLMSAPATVTGTNYIMGDFSDKAAVGDYDGCLDFEDEFFDGLGLSYGTIAVDALFNAEVDYTQTFGSDPLGLPDPDGIINLNDLIVFALNYSSYNCDNFFDPYAKIIASGPVAMGVEIPRNVQAGSEFTATFTADNASSVFAYHAVFDYNAEVLEVVSVDAGTMYHGVASPFFDGKIKDNKLDVGSVIVGAGSFMGDEMFTVTFKAKISGPVEIEDVLIDCIDAENTPIDVKFTATKTAGELPTDYALAQNYPNPFNPSTTIEFSLPTASDYRLTIYNITGQVVTSFVGNAEAGIQSVVWDAARNASGIYFYKIETDSFSAIRKMVLLK